MIVLSILKEYNLTEKGCLELGVRSPWRWGLEYADYPQQTGKHLPEIGSILCLIVNGVWWWGSTYGLLGSVEYPFIDMTPRSVLTQESSTF